MDFWDPDVQISDIENELKNNDVNACCSKWNGEGDSPLHRAALLGTKAYPHYSPNF